MMRDGHRHRARVHGTQLSDTLAARQHDVSARVGASSQQCGEKGIHQVAKLPCTQSMQTEIIRPLSR